MMRKIKLRLPAGTYTLSEPWELPSNVILEGPEIPIVECKVEQYNFWHYEGQDYNV